MTKVPKRLGLIKEDINNQTENITLVQSQGLYACTEDLCTARKQWTLQGLLEEVWMKTHTKYTGVQVWEEMWLAINK